MIWTLLKQLFVTVAWREWPVWISPHLRRRRMGRGKHVQRVWIDEHAIGKAGGKTFVGLGSVDTSHIRSKQGVRPLMVFLGYPVPEDIEDLNEPVTPEECGERIVQALGLPDFDDLLAAKLEGRILRLDIAITEFSLGSGLLRSDFELALGFGHVWLQVEGVLSEPSAGSTLLCFAERRRDSGIRRALATVTPIRSFNTRRLLEDLSARVAHNIIAEIHYRMGGEPVQRGK